MQLPFYRPEDPDGLVERWRRSGHGAISGVDHSQPRSSWRRPLQEGTLLHYTIVIAERGGHVAAFLALDFRRRVVEQLFVNPALQGSDAGSALLNVATRLCPEGLSLSTLVENLGARAFYERHGFVVGAAGHNPVNGRASIA